MKNLLACAALAAAFSAQAVNIAPSDSVWLRPVADPETHALRALWSPDGSVWHDATGPGVTILSSDFGAWGSHKKMYDPELSFDPATGLWTCRFYVTDRRQTVGVATSPDLVEWNPQRYYPAAEGPAPVPGRDVRTTFRTVNRLRDYAELQRYRRADEKMTCAADTARFAGLSELTLSIAPHPDRAYDVSDMLVGIFFEDINYAADGGLYGELVQNRDFQYTSADKKRWTPTHAWAVHGDATLATDSIDPIHANNAVYGVLTSAAPGASLTNTGWNGIPLRGGEKYDFSAYLRGGRVRVELVAPDGSVLASQSVRGGNRWRKAQAVLVPAADCDSASLRLVPASAGRLDLDMVSLFPRNTFKNRRNGLRRDLAEVLDSLHPRFVRFPGGCVAHGNGIDNIYDWKGSVGPLEARKPLSNLWGYHQTRGLGYYEYFQFCEDIGAEPLPVLAAGVPCQNSSRPSHCSHDEMTACGQQGGIPMEDLDAYIQDIFDLIEWANGDPKTNRWARLRAESGHPAPFNLKYLGIGNEDMITEVFEERFEKIFNAVSERYPEITVVGTVGPFHSGADYNEGYRIARRLGVPVVDEHYYVPLGWMLSNRDYYDAYDRNGPKVYLGEYAVHNDKRTNTVENALGCALWLTDVERNGDIVAMTSYAPLLSKRKHTQWTPDLIYFTNNDLQLTTDYYVQQAFAANPGAAYIPTDLTLLPEGYVAPDDPEKSKKIDFGTPGVTASDLAARLGCSLMRASDGTLVLKLVNLLPVPVRLTAPTADAQTALTEATTNTPTAATTDAPTAALTEALPGDILSATVFEGAPASLSFARTDAFTGTLPAYSLTVLRLSPR